MALRFLSLVLGVILLSQCAPVSSPPSQGAPAPAVTADGYLGGPERSARAEDRANRPGLATAFGDEIRSVSKRGSFIRGYDKPSSVMQLFYNDKAGVDALIGDSFVYNRTRWLRTSDERLRWGVKSGFSLLKAQQTGSGHFITAKKGKPYSIILENISDSTVEVVVSVDGLDVQDGKRASLEKRGYIVGPDKQMEIKGFRTASDSVAQFRFSSVNASYSALKHGDTRNVGVIGVAVFSSLSTAKEQQDAVLRGDARSFATAP